MYGLLLLLTPAAIQQNEADVPRTKRDVVLRWNEAALLAIRTERTPPPMAARNLAILHTAIYDAVNTVERTHQPYRVVATSPPGTSAESAAAVAAHRVLISLYPRQVERFDTVLDESLADVPDGQGKRVGMLLGQGVAERMLEWRRRDGADQRTAYKPRMGPGLWRPTPPGFREALLPHWPSITSFCLKSNSQFRPVAAPALHSAEYAASFREVKLLGSSRSTVRTVEQTAIAQFWADDEGTVTPPGHWNRIAQTVAEERGTRMAENARMFALLNLALADAGIACWDCKFAYHVWRPVYGIREADPTVHPDTTPERDWTPLLTTPPFPSYTSGHSTFSAAAATILARFFGRDDIRFSSTSESLPGVTRTFARFSDAADEAGKSRVYGGIHWEFDNREGLACGRDVGNYVWRHFLLPREDVDVKRDAGRESP